MVTKKEIAVKLGKMLDKKTLTKEEYATIYDARHTILKTLKKR